MQRKPGRVRAEKPVLLLAPQRYGQCGGLRFMGSSHGSVAAEACQAPPSTARGTAAWVGDMYSQPIRRSVRQRAMRCACHDSMFASFPGVSSVDVATCCTRATKGMLQNAIHGNSGSAPSRNNAEWEAISCKTDRSGQDRRPEFQWCGLGVGPRKRRRVQQGVRRFCTRGWGQCNKKIKKKTGTG